jgi:hypothetical protein
MSVMGGVLVAYCAAQLFNRQLLRVEDRDYLERLAGEAERRASVERDGPEPARQPAPDGTEPA